MNKKDNKQDICPVMKVSVDRNVAEKLGLVREYKGKKYYFCCGDCPPQFDENPEKYVNAQSLNKVV